MALSRHILLTFSWFAVLELGAGGIVLAQEVDEAGASEETAAEPERVDRYSPLAAAQGLMLAAEQGDFEGAAEFLDLRYLPSDLAGADSQRLAEQLYIVISRKLVVDFGRLSNDPQGVENDALPSYRDLLGEIESPGENRSIYLQRIPGPNDTRIWKISNATVAQIPSLYAEFGYSPWTETVRNLVPNVSILGVELFKFIVAILFGVAAVLAWLIIAWPLGKMLTRHIHANEKRVKRYLTRPVPAAIFILIFARTLHELGLGVTASRYLDIATLQTLLILWLLFASIDLARDLYASYLRRLGRQSGVMLLRPIAAATKTLVCIFALVFWLDNIGVNVIALVAGLGVGGVAVALVLQKPLEDVLGAITLFTQQPVSIGQFCTCGNITGTIEEISMRATRVRKLNNNLVVIPNSTFATAVIENYSARRRTLHRQIVRMALDTTQSQIQAVLQHLREIMESHPKVISDDLRIRFVEFSEYSIDIEIFAHVDTTVWVEFLAIAEELNLATVGALETAGTKLAAFRDMGQE